MVASPAHPLAVPGEPLRTLMTVDSVGGVWQYGLDLARGLALHGIETTLVVLGPEPLPGQRAEAEAVPGCRLLCTNLPLDWTAPDSGSVEASGEHIARLAADLQADLVHLHAPALGANAAFLCPVLAVCHSCVATWWQAVRGGPLPADFAWRTRLTGRGLGHADALIAPTRAFADAVAATYGLVRSPQSVWNGRTPRPIARERADSEPGAFAFTAGRLWDEAKNLATMDGVASRLSVPFLAAGPLAGPNGTTAAVQSIRPLGRLSDHAVGEILAERPVFVSLARYEPFGLAVLEAAQAGCPLVLADIATFRELWNGAAIFVPADDEQAACDAIEAIIGESALRENLAKAARERSHRYSVEAMTTGVLGIYRRLLQKNDPCEAAA